MKSKLLLFLGILLISSFGYSQYNYEVRLKSFNDLQPQEVFSIISKRLDYSSKQIVESRIRFESKYNYTEEKLRRIIQESGFELESFTMSKNIKKIRYLNR